MVKALTKKDLNKSPAMADNKLYALLEMYYPYLTCKGSGAPLEECTEVLRDIKPMC
jgi:hypothetical protein